MSLNELQQEDLQGIKDVWGWPYWPLLPMKRYNKDHEMEVGFLFADASPPPPKIYVGNVHSLPEAAPGLTWRGVLKDLQTKEYASLETMLEDGWRVD